MIMVLRRHATPRFLVPMSPLGSQLGLNLTVWSSGVIDFEFEIGKLSGQPHYIENHNSDGQSVQPGRERPSKMDGNVTTGHFVFDHIQQTCHVLKNTPLYNNKAEVVRSESCGYTLAWGIKSNVRFVALRIAHAFSRGLRKKI